MISPPNLQGSVAGSPKVTDARLEVLREAYAYLAEHETWHGTDRMVKDAEHATLFAELQEHRSRVCPECNGTTWILNPKFCDDGGFEPEDMDCPRCNGVGYMRPVMDIPKPLAPQQPHLDSDGTELPF